MKNKIITFLAVSLLLVVTGCGEKAEVPAVAVESIKPSEENQDSKAEDNFQEEKQKQNIQDASQTENQQENTETLEVIVKNIEESSVVGSKVSTWEEDGNDIAVVMAEGNENEVLITINFSDNAVYQMKTVKNGGVNGDADVTVKEASFSYIKEGASLTLMGYYVTADVFMAEQAVIYEFI